MGRHTGPTDKLSRREGINLMLKGARSESGKIERRMVPPGMHSWRRGKGSEYRLRLRETQKVKRYYGIRDRQFMNLYRQAGRTKGDTGAALLSLLERRLDNVIHKLGMAPSRPAARQVICHGHIYINDRRVSIASYRVRVGEKVTVKPSDKSQALIRANLDELGEPRVQNWLQLDQAKLAGEILAVPSKDDVMIPVEANLVVEFCSR